MTELRVHDAMPENPELLIPLRLVLSTISEVVPDFFSGKWEIFHGAFGYGAKVCGIDDALESRRSVIVDADELLPELLSGSEYFENARIRQVDSGLEIGVHDSTFYFVRGDRQDLEKLKPRFHDAEIVTDGQL